MLEVQPDNKPTRKSLTTAIGGVLPLPFVLPAVQEAWDRIPDDSLFGILAGPQMTSFLTVIIAALVSNALGGLLPAWFVQDRWGRPDPKE
jgi:hypothetical protein